MTDINRAKRLLESKGYNIQKINEMAYERSDAIDRCASLGAKFIEHFREVYSLGVTDIDFNHHCSEMQNWFEDASNIVLKSSKKLISNNQLIDWFFTRGSSIDIIFQENDIANTYDELMVELLSTKRSKKVVDIMKELLES